MHPNSSWRQLTHVERRVVELLWNADVTARNQFIPKLNDLTARSTGEVGRIFLGFSDRINSNRQGSRSFPYMAEMSDQDGVLIQIILFTDVGGGPFELEIARSDGADVIGPIRIEDLKVVRDGRVVNAELDLQSELAARPGIIAALSIALVLTLLPAAVFLMAFFRPILNLLSFLLSDFQPLMRANSDESIFGVLSYICGVCSVRYFIIFATDVFKGRQRPTDLRFALACISAGVASTGAVLIAGIKIVFLLVVFPLCVLIALVLLNAAGRRKKQGRDTCVR